LNDTRPAGVPAPLEIDIRRKTFRAADGAELDVMRELRLSITPHRITALIGPSGCGKTTLLRILASLEAPGDGAVKMPAGARIGMVFQEPRLLPWRTVMQNIRIAAPAASSALIAELFAALGLQDHANHYPSELSLGLARRVAVARAFAIEPDILLLDEPFVSLDAKLREQLKTALLHLVGQRPITVLLVTHDIEEAAELADEIVVFSARPARVLDRILVPTPREQRSPATITALTDDIHKAGLLPG